MRETDEYIEITNDEPVNDDRPVDIPVITIESAAAPDLPLKIKKKKNSRRKAIWIVASILAVALIAGALWRYRFWLMSPSVTSSVSDSKNLALLSSAPGKPQTVIRGVEATRDSVLDVAFTAYPLDNLRGSLEKELPDTADRSVVLMMRSADYYPDGSTIGTVVVDGQQLPARERRTRPGYIAIAKNGTTTIGISLTDRVPDFISRVEGSFFRQFAILGNGDLPSAFALHGKVERGAIGRMADGSLYYFLSRDKESMYDFADALREYGVMDAVYVTGGNGYDFYRDQEGTPHVSPQLRDHYKKYPDRIVPAPMLVFRTPGNK